MPRAGAPWRTSRPLAVQLNRAGAIAREYGLRFFYHNHDFEFTTLRADGRPVYTVLLEEPDPSLVKFQMDLMWIHFGGGPWREQLTTMSDRFISFHVKDQSPEAAPGCGCDLFADPGQGVVPPEEMLATAGNPRNRRYTVERHSQVHPLTSAKIGYDFCAASASNKAERRNPPLGRVPRSSPPRHDARQASWGCSDANALDVRRQSRSRSLEPAVARAAVVGPRR